MAYQEGEQPLMEERQPLNRERIFVIGGASGTGAELAKAVHKLGAEVIVSSTKQDKLDALAQTLGGERIHTFVADLTKPEEFYEGLHTLITREGIIPSAVVHSAAGGMEGFSRELMRDIRKIGSLKNPQEREEALRNERKKLRDIVLSDENIATAMAINFYGHAIALNLLRDLIPSGAQVKDIYWSSIWSDLGKMDSAFKDSNDTSEENGIDAPSFYLGIAGSKGRFVRWQKENADKLVAHGIYPAVVSGHIINDSDVGKMIDVFIFSTLLPEDQHAEMKKYYITQQDMVNATINLIQSYPTTWPEYPNRVFVVGGRPVNNRLLPNDPMFNIKIPL